jgi:hypothetical protein
MRDYPIVKKVRELTTSLSTFEVSLSDVAIALLGALPDWPITDGGEELDTENFCIYEINEMDMLVSCGGDWQDAEMLRVFLTPNGLTYRKIAWDFKKQDICETDKIPGNSVFERIEALEQLFSSDVSN